jgi:hypothetical protein
MTSETHGTGGESGAPENFPAYKEFHEHFPAFLVEYLIDLSQAFGGDLEQVLILLVLRRLHLRIQIRGAQSRSAPQTSSSASQLSELTAIPRQTVRRKLLDMKSKGWLDQDCKHGWRLAVAGGRSNALSFVSDDERWMNFVSRVARLYGDNG